MKYLHFEDWSLPGLIQHVEQNGLPHAGKIIKVFASDERPDERFRKPNLTIIESPDEPFRDDEIFEYEGNGTFTGNDLEEKLAALGIDDKAKELMRALFRFENRPELGFCQASMGAKNPDGSFRFTDPFAGVDGVYHVTTRTRMPENSLHLDIFFPESILKLGQIVNLNDPTKLLECREARKLKAVEGRIVNPSIEGK